ncbi:hypothetical protein HD554DRAFT_2130171 [Boletus coccyginus]|nr:hypothetical protein HD554DRAFT_2130171 [Boletus coccyginus]
MTTLHKPLGKRRALLIAIRHVHREAGLKFGNLPNIDLTHRDAKALRDFLIASHGYHTDDIILMMDDKNHPKHLWPTHGKILHQIDRLTSDAPEDCRFFFYFSGHCLKDGTDNVFLYHTHTHGTLEIVCADAKPILGHANRLVTPLQNVKGSKLFTLFDCSHSEGLFDLQRGIGPNKHSRVRKFDPGRLFTGQSIFRLSLPISVGIFPVLIGSIFKVVS